MSPHRRHSGPNHQHHPATPTFDKENGPWPCSAPAAAAAGGGCGNNNRGCLFLDGNNEEHVLISSEDLATPDAVAKLICSNESCPTSLYMHMPCFEAFQENALSHLRAAPRAKGWTEKQRAQNLWTKRGYDLVYKACECSCGHGHIRKDLDWTGMGGQGLNEEVGGAKRKRKKSKSQSGGKAACGTTITIGLPIMGLNGQTQHTSSSSTSSPNSPAAQPSALGQHAHFHNGHALSPNGGAVRRSDAQQVPRNRTNSISSSTSTGSGSLTSSSPAELGGCGSPSSNEGHAPHNAPFNGYNAQPPSHIFQPPQNVGAAQNHFTRAGTGMQRPMRTDRIRHDSGGSIFSRRQDYSSFNVLPKHKINSYHIKMEDECSIGNDETRIFILSSFASNKMSRVPCVVCSTALRIYDRYPLIDGTFFLTPKQQNKSCVQVKYENKTHFLTAVCMGCLEGWTASIQCKKCFKPWTGGHFILGTMYTYDIFAATPCCAERLKCNNCCQLVIHPDQRFNFFSDYSQMVSCPNCGVQDVHFCKNLSTIYNRQTDAQKMALQASMQQQQPPQQLMQQQHLYLPGRGQMGGMGSYNLGLPASRAHRVNSA